MKESIVKDKSYDFALRIILLTKWLREEKEFELASQLLRSGTSIGSNIEEALAGISRADFAAKMGIASREARETNYRLRLLRDAKIVPPVRITPLIDDSLELVRMLTAIVKTVQSSRTKN